MSNEPQSEETPERPAPETEVDAQAARLITERLREITTRANRSIVWFRVCYAASLLCVLSGVFLYPLLFGRDNPLFLPIAFLSALLGAVGMFLTLWGSARKAPRFNAAQIARQGGTQAIPSLFAALKPIAMPTQRKEMRDALTLLLPQLKSSDAYLLTPDSRQMIRWWLDGVPLDRQPLQCEDALRIAALKALEKVGDAKDVPVVERLAQRQPRAQREEKIKQAAMECLPKLLMNCGEMEAARTLLRASQAEDAHSATLLRPASGAGQTDSAELLRGAEPPNTKE